MIEYILGERSGVMFGYVKAATAELRLREYEYYRASYCGLCRAMGSCTGQCSRLTLSYDLVLLANVRMALLDTVPAFRRRRCLVHPMRRRQIMEPNAALALAADASAILAFEKCRDDLADERGWRKIKARMRYFALKGAYRRAKKRHPKLAEGVRLQLARLAEKEAEKCPSVDAVSAIFGELLADVLAEDLEGNAALIARQIGWEIGRFIYTLDALDDLEEDREKGRFNPFLLLYGRVPTAEEKQEIAQALYHCLADLEAAVDLLPDGSVPERTAVLKNILYLGMPDALRQVLRRDCNEKEEPAI
ncbi:MAG: hypothetical protein E7590_10080 [Ruminococcaceae bacterium]|nr:hypothetical protein [Oscillospiraceae bacterium]